MKKSIAICLVLLLLLSNVTVFAADPAEDASVSSGCNTIDGAVPYLGVQTSVKNCQAAILYETNTDTLMYAQNADTQLPPSSLLKILTALIAIEKGNMSDVVMVKAETLATLPSDAVSIDLVAEEVVTVQDLLYGMMVGSGNDAAAVLAEHIMGSQQAFVDEMNRYAQALGCNATNFTNVHGLHDDDQYTTARDVVRILTKAVQNEIFCEIFGEKYYNLPETNKSETRYLASQNYLMNNDKVVDYFDERVTGSRTAVANDRTRSIASVAQANDMKLICVVMGAESKYEDDGYTVKVFGSYKETTELLNLGFTGNKTTQILHSNQTFLQKSVMDGSSDVMLGTNNGVFAVVPENINENSLTYRYVNEVPMTAPIDKGQKAATLQVWLGAVCIAQADLFTMNKVLPAGSVFGENTAGAGNIGFIKVLLYLLGGIALVVIVGFGVLYLMRTTYIVRAKRRSRRNSRNRRRSR